MPELKYVTKFGSIVAEVLDEFNALIDEEKFEAFFGKLSPVERLVFTEFLHSTISYKVCEMNFIDIARAQKKDEKINYYS